MFFGKHSICVLTQHPTSNKVTSSTYLFYANDAEGYNEAICIDTLIDETNITNTSYMYFVYFGGSGIYNSQEYINFQPRIALFFK